MVQQPPPLAHRPLYEEVAAHLRQRILARQLEPGAWIDEQQLSLELGTSRTPMREALKVLAAEGLVTMRPRRGAYVTEANPRDVREAYELLALLESDAAARVAEQASDAQIEELRHLHARLEQCSTVADEFFAANERFHLRILEIEGNRWRLQFATELRQLMKLNRHHSLFKTGRIQDSLTEHRELLQAICARDAARARQIAVAHFQHGLGATHPGDPAPPQD